MRVRAMLSHVEGDVGGSISSDVCGAGERAIMETRSQCYESIWSREEGWSRGRTENER